MKPKVKDAAETLAFRMLRQQVRGEAQDVIRTGAWIIDGKEASIILPNGTAEHDAIAVEVGAQLQRAVSGRTPKIVQVGDNFLVTTEKLILQQAQKTLTQAQARG